MASEDGPKDSRAVLFFDIDNCVSCSNTQISIRSDPFAHC